MRAMMSVKLWMLCGVGLLLCLPAAAEEVPGVEVELHLRGGSEVRGWIDTSDTVRLKTPYGALTIPFGEIKSIRWGDPEEEERDAVYTTQGAYTGWLEVDSTYAVDTGFGVLKIPADQIKRMRILIGDNTDDFESGHLDGWVPYQGSWSLADGQLVGAGDSSYNSQLHFDEVLEESYTVEVTLMGAQHQGVLWNANGPSDLYLLWFQSGQIYVYGGANWWNTNMATYSLPATPDGSYRVRLEVEGLRTQVFVNNQAVGTVTTNRDKGRAGVFVYNLSGRFDDFRVQH